MHVKQDNLQLLSAAGLLPANANPELRARIQTLSTEEIQSLIGTRARVAQDQFKGDHGFLMI